MPVKVSKISMQGFRGATAPVEIPLDTEKPVIMVFGENGTGKSTIADAFDFVCNCGLGSLEDRSVSGQKKGYVATLRRRIHCVTGSHRTDCMSHKRLSGCAYSEAQQYP